ncbi:hypothetical protein CQW23_06286 [Capsicum baccatum]|uniref:Uncharacterized protein n=1 Tax=Capsicum baccatum TaxID=33114 RepID=A0A2G2X2V3_CAPBA|nr:hypothetical protein CQW23_06286 [Capsicum baccatum]
MSGKFSFYCLPDKVLTCGYFVTVLDLSHSSIQYLPATIDSLSSLQSTVEYGSAILEYFTFSSSIADYLKEVSLVIG